MLFERQSWSIPGSALCLHTQWLSPEALALPVPDPRVIRAEQIYSRRLIFRLFSMLRRCLSLWESGHTSKQTYKFGLKPPTHYSLFTASRLKWDRSRTITGFLSPCGVFFFVVASAPLLCSQQMATLNERNKWGLKKLHDKFSHFPVWATQTILDGKEVVTHRFEGDVAHCVCFQRWMLYMDCFQLTIAHLTAQWIVGD